MYFAKKILVRVYFGINAIKQGKMVFRTASENLHSKHPRNRTTPPSIQGIISHTKDRHKNFRTPTNLKIFKIQENVFKNFLGGKRIISHKKERHILFGHPKMHSPRNCYQSFTKYSTKKTPPPSLGNLNQ